MLPTIFLSYAREDDRAPPTDPESRGFVAALCDHLSFEFSDLDYPRPDVWRDVDHVRGVDQFDPTIEHAINCASLFIAVLSVNWIAREYCQKELALFRSRWQDEEENTFKRRVFVIHKNFLDRTKHPALLMGQTGYRFFDFVRDSEMTGKERFFFRGKIINHEGYSKIIRTAAYDLWSRSREFGTELRSAAPDPTASSEALSKIGPSRNPPPEPAPRNGRTVYLAKPGLGSELAYERLANELIQQGFEICPRKDEEIPPGEAAVTFIDRALVQSEMSVHLVGAETAADFEMTRTQLVRAARLVETTTAGFARGFRRVVWAPKVLEADTPGASSRRRMIERDPLKALMAIDTFLPSDKVDGGTIDDFVIFLLQNLDLAADKIPEIEADASAAGVSDCYIFHDSTKDSALARRVAKALQRCGVDPIMPSRQGDESMRETLHRRRLQECDAVLLCWGEAPDVWAKAYSLQLKDWKQLGRSKQFKFRGLVVGPPPDEVKEDVDFWPRKEIDVIVPVSSPDGPSPENLAGLGIGTVMP